MSHRRHRKRPEKDRQRPARGEGVSFGWRPSRRTMVAGLAAAALIGALVIGGLLFSGLIGGSSGPKTAAIVDQLSLTAPNPDFVESATATLEQSGYEVDYYPGERVTVDFYRDLPTFDYDLIILRVHSGITTQIDLATGERTETEYVSLFTSEPYSEDRYAEEQVNGLGKSIYYEGADPLFSIAPRFIEDIMRGRFDNTLIVMMGCDGLRSERTAEAFLHKGASAFVSWSRSVSADHSDAATERFLEHLLLDGLPPEEAVGQTAVEVGRDPSFGAELRILSAGE